MHNFERLVGAVALARALKQNTALVSLHIALNDVSPGTLTAFANALDSNTSLTSLDLMHRLPSLGD